MGLLCVGPSSVFTKQFNLLYIRHKLTHFFTSRSSSEDVIRFSSEVMDAGVLEMGSILPERFERIEAKGIWDISCSLNGPSWHLTVSLNILCMGQEQYGRGEWVGLLGGEEPSQECLVRSRQAVQNILRNYLATAVTSSQVRWYLFSWMFVTVWSNLTMQHMNSRGWLLVAATFCIIPHQPIPLPLPSRNIFAITFCLLLGNHPRWPNFCYDNQKQLWNSSGGRLVIYNKPRLYWNWIPPATQKKCTIINWLHSFPSPPPSPHPLHRWYWNEIK